MEYGTISKGEWISLFQAIGLKEAEMSLWHRLFEERHADAHQAFLTWLNIPPDEIQQIRNRCRGG